MLKIVTSITDMITNMHRSKAETELAYAIWKNEYRNETFDYVYSLMRAGKLKELYEA